VFTSKCHALQGRSTKRLTVATGFYFGIATASAVRTFLIPETVRLSAHGEALDSTPFFPDAPAPTPDALAIEQRKLNQESYSIQMKVYI
jgi:hypothetical protein